MKLLRDKTYEVLQKNTRDLVRILAHTPNARVEEAIQALTLRASPLEYSGSEGCVPYSVTATPRHDIERLLDRRLKSLVSNWVWEMTFRHFDAADRTEEIIRGILDRRYVRYRVSGKTTAAEGRSSTQPRA